MPNTQTADDLLAKAECLAKGTSTTDGRNRSFLSKVFSFLAISSSEGGDGPEDIAEAFQAAGNSLKASQRYQEASEAFEKAAKFYQKAGNSNDYTNSLVTAATLVQSQQPARSLQLLVVAVDEFLQAGRFSTGARWQKRIGELQQSLGQYCDAEAAYRKAGELFLGEDGKALAVECFQKAATTAAARGEWVAALGEFERICQLVNSWEHSKFSLPDYLTSACLLQLVVSCQKEEECEFGARIERFLSMDDSFEQGRAADCLSKIAAALESSDGEEFRAAREEAKRNFQLASGENSWRGRALQELEEFLLKEPNIA